MSEAWFGAIPSHWKVVKLGDIAEFINGYSFKSSELDTDGDVCVIRISDIGNGRIDYSKTLKYSGDDNIAKQLVHPNDILIAMTGSIGKIAVATDQDVDCYINQRVGIIRTDHYDWVYSILTTDPAIQYLTEKATGTAQLNISTETIKNMPIPLPPLEEQHQIVEYLYGKDTKVQLTEAQKIIADQLKHKQSIIAEYVTGKKSPSGITYDSYKDSGIDWIGEIPSDWDVVKLGDITTFAKSGGTPTSSNSEYYADDGTPWVAIGDITKSDLIYDTVKHLTPSGIASKNLKIYPVGTLLYSMYASLGKVGELMVPATVNQAILAFDVKQEVVDKSYIKAVLRAFEPFVMDIATVNTQANLNMGKVLNIDIPLPPLPIQRAIVAELDAVVGEADAVIANAEKLINELKAYKTAVVFECVTKGLDPTVQTKEVQAGGIV